MSRLRAVRHEIVSTYLWLRQFWPWHRRPRFAVRWAARHFILNPPTEFVLFKDGAPYKAGTAIAMQDDTIFLDDEVRDA